MKLKINKIAVRERNVLLGFVLVTIIFILLTKMDYWIYGLYLYGAHIIVMMLFYTNKVSKKE